MNSSFHRVLPALLAAVLLQSVSAAESPAKSETDEVLVNGERVKLDAMRHEIIHLEDQFYSRYNELNTIRDFDIQCTEEARTGTRFIKRSCRPMYQEKAVNAEGKAAFEVMQSIRSRGMAESPPVPAAVEIERRRLEFRRNMEEVARRNPELTEVLRQRDELIERYKAQQKKIFGSDPPQD